MAKRSLFSAFADAADGLVTALREQRNLQIQLAIALAVVVAAAWLRFDALRWAVLIVTIGVVVTAELGNTALERAVDCASPEERPQARAAKHAGAAAVLAAALMAAAVGVALFGSVLLHR